jgi:hypothetical protein
LQLDTRLQQPGPANQKIDGTMTLTGDWVVTVSDDADSGYTAACELRGAHVTGKGFGDVAPADVARLERRLGSRFWVSYQRDGAARQLHFPKELPDDVRNFLTLIVTQSQLVRPPQASDQWTATERDGAGTYLASYHQGTAHELVKQKLRYLSVDGAVAAQGAGLHTSVNVNIEGAETTFTLDGDQLGGLTSQERMHIDASLGGLALGVEIHLALTNARRGREDALIGSLERARPDVESGPVITQRASDEELAARKDARLLKDATLPALLKTVEENKDDGKAEWRTRDTLAAWFRRRPADIAAGLAFVDRASDGARARIVLEALGAAGTAPAQAALCGIASDAHKPAERRVDALTALVGTASASPATVSALIELMAATDANVSRQALYVAGGVAHQSLVSDPAGAQRIETELLSRLSRAKDGHARADVLASLGNLGTKTIVPAIEHALQDPDVQVRVQAARALRKIEGPAADKLVVATMTGDGEARVRQAAIAAAGERAIGPFVESLAQLVTGDPVDFVRTTAIETAAHHVNESPVLRDALAEAAAHDHSPGVQRLARKALGTQLAQAEKPAATP